MSRRPRRRRRDPRYTPFDFGVSTVMGLFHQDWTHDGDTAPDVVARYLDINPEHRLALAVRRDARILRRLPSPTLEVLWEAAAERLPPIDRLGGGSEWTRTVVDLCDARLAKATVRELRGADAEDGSACLDAVVTEIEQITFLTTEVRSALTDCARHCTPDLALRILLRAMTNVPQASLPAAQYTRLEAIGSAMRYGEYVVDNISFLVEDS
ncbi:hypothetical protein ABT026_18125 [Streptomyces sp. NPDC002734]|uniref:hypothetical protein n=1 Tax=Streptomyces sp. NPDC002734 TaxID=3154426 RepID=UPI00332B1E54